MLSGYFGRYLWMDLTQRRATAVLLEESLLRAVVGGVGLGAVLLSRRAPAGADPFAPENPLIFVASPFVGTGLTTTAKYAVVARSPLTGFIGDSLSSSHLALALKRAGWDALAITGACEVPSVLVVDHDEIRIEEGGALWGEDAAVVEERLRAELGGDYRIATIGVAGENGVRYATITNDGRHAGRGGLGAVMGSKRLKAVAVRGSRPVPVADPAGLREAASLLAARSRGAATSKYRLLGTAGNLLTFDRLGALPAHNFRQSTFAGAERISGETLAVTRRVGTSACASCTIGCEHFYKQGSGTARLEYETLFALGPLVGIDDPDVILAAGGLCDTLGLDTISAGGTLAWAMECFERGALSLAETDGLELRFGNGAALLAALPKMGRREGIGRLLAEGTRRAAEMLGRGSEQWAVHVKGMELPGYEPRSLKTMALGLATSSRGACHNRSGAYEADFSGEVDRLSADAARGALAAASEDHAAVLDSLILCKFVRRCFADFYTEAAHLLRLVTGWDVDGDELRRVGARITNLKKLYNEREGWTREDDTLPPRILTESLADGPAAGVGLTRAELDTMIAAYYGARGWSDDGRVTEETATELGIEKVDGCSGVEGQPSGVRAQSRRNPKR
jgi:aldehyde:ferredoxin oxidoreductase